MAREPLTTGEMAKYCHVTHRTVLNWIEEGKIKAFTTPGGHYRVQPEDFLEFLKCFGMPVPEDFEEPGKTKRILVVDDDRGMVSAMRRALHLEKDYEIEVAFDGFDAGRQLLEFRPDLIILDIRMPGMDGYEVTRRLRSTKQGRDLKIIAASAYFKQEGKNKVQELGADACLDKPFDVAELLALIRKLLQ